MPGSMNLKEFISACEENLRRVEGVVDKPLQLQSELELLEELLRNEWPDAIIQSRDIGLSTQDKEKMKTIFQRIKGLQTKTSARVSFFDGIESFMEQPRNR